MEDWKCAGDWSYFANIPSSLTKDISYSSWLNMVKTVTMFSSRSRSRVGSQNSKTPSACKPGWIPIATSGRSTFNERLSTSRYHSQPSTFLVLMNLLQKSW